MIYTANNCKLPTYKLPSKYRADTMLLLSVRQKAVFRKWIGTTTAIVFSSLPVIMALFFASSTTAIACLSIHTFILSKEVYLALRKIHFFRQPKIPFKDLRAPHSKSELKLSKWLKKLSQKANVKMPPLFIGRTNHNDKKKPLEPGYSMGWPYCRKIVIKQSVSDIYSAGASKAILGHELAHILNYDSFWRLITSLSLEIAKVYTRLSLMMSTLGFIAGVASILLLGLPLNSFANLALLFIPAVIFSVFKGVELIVCAAKRYAHRAQETIADLDAAHMLKYPERMAYLFDEIRLNEMNRGFVEKKDEPSYLNLTKNFKHNKLLKNVYVLIHKKTKELQKKDPSITPGEVFEQLLAPKLDNILKKNPKVSCRETYEEIYFEIFKRTHPKNEDRKANIIEAFNIQKKKMHLFEDKKQNKIKKSTKCLSR